MKIFRPGFKFRIPHKSHTRWSALSSLAATFRFPLFAFCFSLTAISCSQNPGSPDTSSAKFKQYFVQGEKLYAKYCSNCHQSDGSGLGRVYPPLNKSDFMEQNFDEVVCLIRYGIEGELVVNGIQFNQPMKGLPALSDLEIAEIATYVYNSWDHQKGIADVREVSHILDACPHKP